MAMKSLRSKAMESAELWPSLNLYSASISCAGGGDDADEQQQKRRDTMPQARGDGYFRLCRLRYVLYVPILERVCVGATRAGRGIMLGPPLVPLR